MSMPLSLEVRTPLWATARDVVAVTALVFSFSLLCDAVPDLELLTVFEPDFATSPLCMPDADAASFPFPQPDTARTRMLAAARTRNDVLIVPSSSSARPPPHDESICARSLTPERYSRRCPRRRSLRDLTVGSELS